MKEKVKLALNEFVKACKEKFGKNLVSIVLFGSYARGKATRYSDIDLLILVKNLPADIWKRDKLLEKLTWKIFLEHGEDLQPLLSTPEETLKAMKWGNPLFFGILLGYKVLYDENSFFERSLKGIVIPRVEKNPPVLIYGGKRWRLEKIIKS